MLVRAGIRRQQAGEIEGGIAIALGGFLAAGIHLVQRHATLGNLGEVIANLRGSGDGLDGLIVARTGARVGTVAAVIRAAGGEGEPAQGQHQAQLGHVLFHECSFFRLKLIKQRINIPN